MKNLFSFSAKEHRHIHLLKENLRDFVVGTIQDHVTTPIKNGNVPQALAGTFVAAGDIAFNSVDAALASLAGQRLERLKAGDTRIGRDIGIIADQTFNAVGNFVTLRPGKAIANVARVGLGVVRAPADFIMDGFDAGGNFDLNRPGGAHYSQSA